MTIPFPFTFSTFMLLVFLYLHLQLLNALFQRPYHLSAGVVIHPDQVARFLQVGQARSGVTVQVPQDALPRLVDELLHVKRTKSVLGQHRYGAFGEGSEVGG